MKNKLLKFFRNFAVFLVVFGMLFSNIPFNALIFLIDSYEKTSGIVDRMWLVQQENNPDVVDKFASLRNISEKLRVMEAMAAAPTFVNKGAFSSGVGALTVGVPAAYQDNDVFLLFVESANQAITTPAGWTQVTNSPQFTGTAAAAGGVRLGVFYKIVTGAQSSVSVADTGNHTTAIIMGFRGVDTATPVNISAGAVSAATTAMSFPTVTTTVVDTFVVLAAAMDTDANSTATVTGWANASLTGIIEQHDQTVTSGVGGGLAIATGVKATAGTTGATTATGSTAVTHAYLTIALKPMPLTTTISNFVSGEPGNSTIAPAASGMVDSFGLQTSGSTDTVTAATIGLAVGMGQYIQTVAITNDGDTVTYCSAAPVGDSASLSVCGIPVSTTNTQFKIKITAKAHASMPVPDGGLYNVTATVTGFTSTNSQAGADSGSSTLTIDNDSPAGTTGAGATSGESTQSTVNWINPGDTDFQQVYIYCKTSSMLSGEAPAEGADPVVDGAACDATARMKYKGIVSSQTITGLTNGQLYYFRIYARDTNGNFTAYSATQEVTGTPSAPSATLTISQTAGTKVATKNSGDVNQYSHDTVCTGAANCAAFTLAAAGGTANVTSIKITESGTAAANTELSNLNLYYDTDGNWADAGAETLFGTAATFAADQTTTISGALAISSGATAYIYARYDLANGVVYPIGGATVNFQIAAAGDVISDAIESGSGTLAGTQTVLPTANSVTYVVSPDGGRTGNSATISGKGFGAPSLDADQQDCVIATVGAKGCVRFIAGGAYTVLGSDISTWNNTTIIFAINSGITSFGGVSALEVVSAAQSTAADLTYYIYPNITSITGTPIADGQREASNVDLNGTRFDLSGNQGTVDFTGGFGTVSAAIVSWSDTLVIITVPAAISDSIYLGDITLTRAAVTGSKTDTAYGSNIFRILPRIATTGSVNLKGGQGDTGVSVNGDHLCQDASCIGSPEVTEDITFNGVTGKSGSTWGHTSITTITIPATATDGPLVITSDGDGAGTFTSNSLTYDIKFAPMTPTGSSGGGSNNPTLSGSVFSDTVGDSDTHFKTQWQLAHNTDADWLTPEWSRNTTTGLVSAVVDTTDTGAFANGDAGQTALDCGVTYKGRVRYMDNGNAGADTQIWEWSSYSADYTFSTASCGPDATSITNNDEPALTDGGRISHINIVINGSGFGTVSVGSRAICAGGAGTGCVKIGGTGGQTIADARVTAWTSTSITIQLSLTDLTTTYGGATTNGLIVYAAGVSDSNGQTFYIYPDITSLSVVEGREGDVITINGNKFGSGTTGATVTMLGAASAIPGDLVIDVSCDNVDGWAETCIKITITTAIADATDSGQIVVTQGTGSNNKTVNATDAQAVLGILPRIVSLTTPADAPDSVSAWQASSITVNGSHFGAYNAANSRVAVNGSTVDPGSGSWGVSAVTLAVPAVATNNGMIQATRGDTKTSNNSATFYVLPKIISTGPTSGEAREGDAITLTGNHFCGTGGACANLPTVRFYNASQTVDVTANSGATNTSLGVSVSSTISDSINNFNLEIVRSAIGGQDDGKSSTNTTRNNFAYTILPDITDVSNPTAYTNAAREYSASDSDGIITVNGNHFGAAGTVTVLGCGATNCIGSGATQVTTGTCTGTAYQATCVGIQIPNTALPDNSYLGNIVITRTSDSKIDTFGSGNYRILPRIISLSPNNGAQNTALTVIGNHFCQGGSASCPVAFSYTTPISNVLFGATNASAPTIWNWTNGDSSTTGVDIKAPAGSGAMAVKVISGASGFDYESNTSNFSYLSTTPAIPDTLEQFKSDGITPISVGGGTNSSSVILEGNSTASTSISIIMEVEARATSTPFTGTPTASSSVQGPGTAFNNVAVTVSGLTDGQYHWQMRAKNVGTGETSNWVSFGGNADGQTDFYVDSAGPIISNVIVPGASLTDIQATITWNTDESATQQVAYGTSCPTGQVDAVATFTALTTKQPSNPAGTGTSHSVVLSNITASTVYYYMVRSADGFGNYSYNPATANSCNNFTTAAPQTRLMKTLEFYIEQATSTGNTFTKTFDVFISESKADRSNIFFKSVAIEIFGVTVGDGAGDITVDANLNSGGVTTYTLKDPGANVSSYWILTNSASSLNFDCSNCTDNATTQNTLSATVNGATNNSLLGAKAVITYYYVPQ